MGILRFTEFSGPAIGLAPYDSGGAGRGPARACGSRAFKRRGSAFPSTPPEPEPARDGRRRPSSVQRDRAGELRASPSSPQPAEGRNHGGRLGPARAPRLRRGRRGQGDDRARSGRRDVRRRGAGRHVALVRLLGARNGRFGAKGGPLGPPGGGDSAPWAPEEGAPEATTLLAIWHRLFEKTPS